MSNLIISGGVAISGSIAANLGAGGGGQTLSVTSGLYAHFKADSLALSDGAEVTTWASEVGSYSFSATSTYKPTYVASSSINGKPVVRNVSGTKYMEMNGSYPSAADFSYFIVGKATSTSQGADSCIIGTTGTYNPRNSLIYNWAYGGMTGLVQYQLDYNNNGSTALSYASADPFLVGYTLDHGVQSTGYLNGRRKYTYSGSGIGNGENGNLRILGTPSSNQFRGDIAEIIIYNRVLSAEEILSVHTYLATKYGITLPSSSPVSFTGSAKTYGIRTQAGAYAVLSASATTDTVTYNIANGSLDFTYQINQYPSTSNTEASPDGIYGIALPTGYGFGDLSSKSYGSGAASSYRLLGTGSYSNSNPSSFQFSVQFVADTTNNLILIFMTSLNSFVRTDYGEVNYSAFYMDMQLTGIPVVPV